jgi:hypothetical protein
LDPDTNAIQDDGRNTSFVVRASIGNTGVKNVKISWSTSDPSSRYEVYSDFTDANGLARIWYIQGKLNEVTVKAFIEQSQESISSTLTRKVQTSNLFGRAVGIGVTPAAGNYIKTEVSATINSEAKDVYYALAVYPGFYTGFQNLTCDGSGYIPDLICLDSRTKYKGREAHFSVWQEKLANGTVLQPLLVESNSNARCRSFDHEGNGLLCMIAFDWEVGDNLRILIEKVDGAPVNYQRIRVSGVNLTSGFSTLLASIDKGLSVDLSETFFMFNENFIPKAKTCMDSPFRTITINSVRLFNSDGQTSGVTSGRSDAPPMLENANCLNYGTRSTPSGIEIYSGGDQDWIDFMPALSALNGKFPDNWWATILQRPISVEVLNR